MRYIIFAVIGLCAMAYGIVLTEQTITEGYDIYNKDNAVKLTGGLLLILIGIIVAIFSLKKFVKNKTLENLKFKYREGNHGCGVQTGQSIKATQTLDIEHIILYSA